MTPEQKQKHLRAIEKIESTSRPAKWRLIKELTFALHPSFVPIDKDFCEAVKELRQASNKTASSASGDMRNTMKIPQYIYEALRTLDEDFMKEASGRNGGSQEQLGNLLYKAFPEYRVARQY